MAGNTGLKFIALAVLFEYLFIKPYVLPQGGGGPDFIGFVLVHAVLAYFGKINIKDLDNKRKKSAYLNGLLGGICGYAWLLLHLPFHKRQVHHLFVANFLILVGVLFGAWAERRRMKGIVSLNGGFLINNDHPKMRRDGQVGTAGWRGCGGGGCGGGAQPAWHTFGPSARGV